MELNVRQKKWVSKVQANDFDIEYKKGKINVGVYALSRKPPLSIMEVPIAWKDHLTLE
jgi:hypothetical protein